MRSVDMRLPDCWHPHLHRGRWHPLRRHADGTPDGDRLVCPTCHPAIGSEAFERNMVALRAHMGTTSKRVT